MCGRDDDYTPDFLYRTATTLNHFARNLNELGRLDDVEIVVTDWGSSTPLVRSLRLLPETVQICRFVYVPPELARTRQDNTEGFNSACAINVALRRATGRFLMMANTDQLCLPHTVETLLRLLDGSIPTPFDICQTLMMVPRLEIPWQFVVRRPDLDEWDRYLFSSAYSLESTSTKAMDSFGGSGGILVHRDIWEFAQGIDERLSGWGWCDIEFGIRVSQNYPTCWLSVIGIFLFHMGHNPTGRRVSAIRNTNPCILNIGLQTNGESWGLGDTELTYNVAETPLPPASVAADDPACQRVNAIPSGSLPETVRSLQHDGVHHHVKSICRALARKNWWVPHSDIDALYFLTWYSMHYFPRSYLEYGVLGGYGAAVVGSSCPSVEIYAVDHWEGISYDNSPPIIADLIREVGFRGRIRFVNGETSTAVRRLRDSSVGALSFDLLSIRTSLLKTDGVSGVADLISHLAPGGAVVFTGHSGDEFASRFGELGGVLSGWPHFVSSDGKTIMFLNSPPPEKALNTGCTSTVSFRKLDLTVALLIRRIRKRIVQVFR